MSGQLPKAFLDFIDHFATQRNDKAIEAIQNAAGMPYGDLCKAYLLQATDPIACRDELLRLAGLPAPFEAWRYQWLGTTYIMLGQLPEAEACFAAAIENNPDDRLKFQVYVNWGGGVTSSNGHNDEDIARRAIAILETGLHLDPPQGVKIRLQANLAINYKLLGRYDEAIQIFQGVREYSLGTGDPLFIAMATSDLADLYRISGQFDKAKGYALSAWKTARDVETVVNDKFGILGILIRVLRESRSPRSQTCH
jgi:tetratricopeptide (TPR) repeat protein